MSKLSARPIIVAGSKCGVEFMPDVDGCLGGSTGCLCSIMLLAWISLFFFSRFRLRGSSFDTPSWFQVMRFRTAPGGTFATKRVREGRRGEGGAGIGRGGYLFEKRSLPRRTRRDTRCREEGATEEAEGVERNRSLMGPSPLLRRGFFKDIC